MQEWHPVNPLYVSNQTKSMIKSNVIKNQISKHNKFGFSNKGDCEPVKYVIRHVFNCSKYSRPAGP